MIDQPLVTKIICWLGRVGNGGLKGKRNGKTGAVKLEEITPSCVARGIPERSFALRAPDDSATRL